MESVSKVVNTTFTTLFDFLAVRISLSSIRMQICYPARSYNKIFLVLYNHVFNDYNREGLWKIKDQAGRRDSHLY